MTNILELFAFVGFGAAIFLVACFMEELSKWFHERKRRKVTPVFKRDWK